MLRSFGSWLPCTSGMFGTSKRVSPFSSRCGPIPKRRSPGTIVLVEATLDESSRSVAIRVVLSNADGRLKPGMFATARITGTHAHAPESLLAIPTAAVQEVDGHTSSSYGMGTVVSHCFASTLASKPGSSLRC